MSSKRARPPAAAAASALKSARKKRPLDGMTFGPPMPYPTVTPRPVKMHKTVILPRDGFSEGASTIMFADKMAWNQIIR
jgi:hypothetical protein